MPLIILFSGGEDYSRQVADGGVGGDTAIGVAWWREVSDGGLGGDTSIGYLFDRRVTDGGLGGDTYTPVTYWQAYTDGGIGGESYPIYIEDGGLGGDAIVVVFKKQFTEGAIEGDTMSGFDWSGDPTDYDDEVVTFSVTLGSLTLPISSLSISENINGVCYCRVVVPDVDSNLDDISDAIEGLFSVDISYGGNLTSRLFQGSIDTADVYRGASSTSINIAARSTRLPRSKTFQVYGVSFKSDVNSLSSLRSSRIHPRIHAGDWATYDSDTFHVERLSINVSGGRASITYSEGPVPDDAPDRWTEVLYKISTSGIHTMAINTAGDLLGWGNNTQKCIDVSAASGATLTNTATVYFSGASKVFANYGRTFVIDSSGDLYGWGDNTDGACNPASVDAIYVDTGTAIVSGMDKIIHDPGIVIASSFVDFTAGITTGGDLILWNDTYPGFDNVLFSDVSDAGFESRSSEIMYDYDSSGRRLWVLDTSGDVWVYRYKAAEGVYGGSGYPAFEDVEKMSVGNGVVGLLFGNGRSKTYFGHIYHSLERSNVSSIFSANSVIRITDKYPVSGYTFFIGADGLLYCGGLSGVTISNNLYGEANPFSEDDAWYNEAFPLFENIIGVATSNVPITDGCGSVIMDSRLKLFGFGNNVYQQFDPRSLTPDPYTSFLQL